MKTMKAAAIEAYGGAENFQIMQLPRPEPEPGELLIRVAYAGVNPADWKFREGHNKAFFEVPFPFVMGFDAAGTVAAVGEGVSRYAVGDRVFTPSNLSKGKTGSYAEYIVADEDRVAAVPEGMNLASAAAIPVAALTGWQGMLEQDKGNLAAGQSVLVNGGAGGLGSFAIQFAKWRGASVATTCSDNNISYVQSLGAELVINYKTQNINEEIARWAPGGLDLIVDAVGSDTLPDAFDMLKQGGKLLSIPTLVRDGDIEADTAEAARRGVSKIFTYMTDVGCCTDLQNIAELVVTGKITMPQVESFDLAEVGAAHHKIQQGHVRGKLVLRIAGESA